MRDQVQQVRQVVIAPEFEEWRSQARLLAADGIAPEDVSIIDDQAQFTQSLFTENHLQNHDNVQTRRITVTAQFLSRAQIVARHRAGDRWQLLYRLLWRLQSDRNLLEVEIDEDVAIFRAYENQVRRDLHKMHAFVRFRKIDESGEEHYVAWYQPAHSVLPLAAPFFAERFAIMRWTIMTPDASASWDPKSGTMHYGPGVPREAAPGSDLLETLWKTYYRSIFNPARINTFAMRSEMPIRYWKNLPEIDALPQMLSGADDRVTQMLKQQPSLTAASFLPAEQSLPMLCEALRRCEGCSLHVHAIQAVSGAGPVNAQMMLVGEQPGDEEDRSGRPFVGPAGRLLDELLRELGVDREQLYVTNAVKHFKFKERGKRRLHESPRMSEITACRPWLLAELESVQPRVVVCLGASAARSLLGANFALMRERGKVMNSPYAAKIVATIHPAAILRATDPERCAEMRSTLLKDLAHSVQLSAISS